MIYWQMREFLPDVREHGILELDVQALLKTDGRLDLYPEVTGKNYLRASLSGDTLQLAAGSFIGLIPLNDRFAITVKPRVDIGRLSRLLQVSGQSPVAIDRLARAYRPDEELPDSLVEVLALAFVSALSSIVQGGLRQEFNEVRETTSFPRGRILLGSSLLNFARGNRHRVDTQTFIPTEDTPENQLLKYALWRLAGQYMAHQRRGHRRMLADTDRLFNAMEGVSLDLSQGFLEERGLSDPQRLGAVWSHYVPAIGLALMIIRNEGIDLSGSGGEIPLPSLLLNMESVFEGYLRETLRSLLSATAEVLDGNVKPPRGAAGWIFRDAAKVEATPDIVVKKASREAVLIEVKYKPTTNRDDLNQAIAYGVAFDARHVVLAHLGTASATGPTTLGSVGNTTIHQYAVNLSADLVQAEAEFAKFVQSLLEAQSPRIPLEPTLL